MIGVKTTQQVHGVISEIDVTPVAALTPYSAFKFRQANDRVLCRNPEEQLELANYKIMLSKISKGNSTFLSPPMVS